MQGEEEAYPEEVQKPFSVADGLSPLEAILKFTSKECHVLQRIAYVRGIPAAAECDSQESTSVLLPVLLDLCMDADPEVRHAAAAVVGPLAAALCSRHPAESGKPGEEEQLDGSTWVRELGVMLQALLLDEEALVQEAAEAAVLEMAPVLDPAQRRELLGSTLRALAQQQDEEVQACAARLLGALVEALGALDPGWCALCALPLALELAQYADYGVRLESVHSIVRLLGCAEASAGDREAVLGALRALCEDAVWSVRQEVAGELAVAAAALPPEQAGAVVLPLRQRLQSDVSQWVRAQAARQAGPLLCVLRPEDSPEELLEAYASAACEGHSRIRLAAAESLPGVLLALGVPRAWDTALRVAAALAVSGDASVRAALAAAMPDIAQQVQRAELEQITQQGAQQGDGRAEEGAPMDDLLPLMELLSQDESPEVSDAFALHLLPLLSTLPERASAQRAALLPRLALPSPADGCGRWRARLLVLQQLQGIAELLGPHVSLDRLVPGALALCRDPVAAVRTEATEQLAAMVGARLLLGGGSSDEAAGEPGCGAADSSTPACTREGAAGTEGGEAGAVAGVHEEQPLLPTGDVLVDEVAGHMLQLRGSACHRDRMCFLSFCSSLLSTLRAAAPPAAALPPPPVQQLLRGVASLAGDPVPNVRLAAARLLAALPSGLAAQGCALSALCALGSDTDQGVREAAAGRPQA